MKAIVTILLSFFYLFPLFLFAQDWERQYPPMGNSRLYDLSIDETGNGWAVGETGTVFHTADFGQNWQKQAFPSLSGLFFVECIPGTNAQKVVACGTKIAVTDDGGSSWTELISGFPTGAYNGLQVPSENAIYIIANTGNVLKSTDFGQSWSDLSLPMTPEWTGISFINDSVGWISSIQGDVLKTEDGGDNWTVLHDTTFSAKTRLQFFDQSLGYLVENRDVYRTTDGGQSWNLQKAQAFPNLITDLHLVGQDHLLVSRAVDIYESTDAGLSWTRYNPLPPSIALYGIDSQPNGQYWVSGSYSVILHSDDAAVSWQDQIPAVKNNLDFVRFLNHSVGLAGGGQRSLLKTTNGGLNWQDISLPDNGTYFTEAMLVSANEYWATTNEAILHTTDGGLNWTEVFSTGDWFSCIQASPNGKLYASHAAKGLYSSSDNGQTWVHDSLSGLLDLAVLNDDTLYAVGYDGVILRTTDGGQNWNAQVSHTTQHLNKIYFTSADSGWVTGFGNVDTVLFTADGGDTWTKHLMPLKGNWREMAWINSQVGWITAASSVGRIYQTTDGGQNWTQVHYNPSSSFSSLHTPLPGQELLWAAGAGGNIEVFNNTSINLDLKEENLLLLQLYPNPSDGELHLQMDQIALARLEIVDLAGRNVLQSKVESPQQSWDLSHLPAGIYVVRLQAGNRQYSQKLQLY